MDKLDELVDSLTKALQAGKAEYERERSRILSEYGYHVFIKALRQTTRKMNHKDYEFEKF